MRKTRKLIGGMFGTGMALGAGSIGLNAVGGTAATNAATGFGNISAALPTVGHLGGAGMVMNSAMGLKNMYKKRKRR